MWLVGELGTTLRPALAAQPTIVTVMIGAPRVHISSVRLVGLVRVEGGELELTDCAIDAMAAEIGGGARRALNPSDEERALSIIGGDVVLLRVLLQGHPAGAIRAHAANLALMECTIGNNEAQSGGAILVSGGSNVTVEYSVLVGNRALVSGGALQVPPIHFFEFRP